MTFYTASFETVLIRYYLMMAVIVASFSFGYPALAILGFPLFIAAISAISFKNKTAKTKPQVLSNDAEEIIMMKTAA